MRIVALLCMCVFASGHPIRLLEEMTTCDAPVATLVHRALAEEVLKNTALQWSGSHVLLEWKFANISDGMARSLSLVHIKQRAQTVCLYKLCGLQLHGDSENPGVCVDVRVYCENSEDIVCHRQHGLRAG